ncbi:hypothetical protein CROQUDRAFT_54163, partial [Cronartium quercuum f. sp. fusiforme G11]
WMKDCLAGLLYQLGAPTSGEFSMEGVNVALDAQYKMNQKPFTAREVRMQMQLVVTNRKAAQKADVIVKAMAVKPAFHMQSHHAESRVTLHKVSPDLRFCAVSGQSFAPNNSRQPLMPLSENTEERDHTIASPIAIPKNAAIEFHNGEDQCFHCGKFRHTRDHCTWSRMQPRTAMHWNDW